MRTIQLLSAAIIAVLMVAGVYLIYEVAVSSPATAPAIVSQQLQAIAGMQPPLPGSLPVTGNPVPELAAFETAMLDFMNSRGIRAGALAVMKNGVLLLERGYGWQDGGLQQPIAPNALFRIASVDKPITAAVIKRLISQGLLKPDAKAFPLLGITQLSDPRLNNITIQHLLEHKAGWDSAQTGFDPCFKVVEIAQALGIPSPADTADIARYMAGQPLQFAPGSKSVYSNFGYALLRLIVERVTNKPFASYLQQEFGLDADRSHAFPKDRNPREIWYSDPGMCVNVYEPKAQAPCADGGYSVESRSLAASASGLVGFLDRYWISGDPRQPGQTGYVYWFYGSLPGTFTFVYQRPDGVNIAALFNQRTDPSGLKYEDIKDMMDKAAP